MHRNLQAEVRDSLLSVLRRSEWQREMLGQPVNRQLLVILKLQTLRRIRRDRRDARAKRGLRLWVRAIPLTRLQQSRVDGLVAQLRIELVRALSLQDDRRYAHRAIPHRKVRNRASGRQRKNIVPFLQ